MAFVASRTAGRTTSRLRAAVATAAVVAGLAAAAAFAAGATSDPDLRAMALAPSDFAPGARVASEHMEPGSGPIVSVFERTFGPGTRLGGSRLLMVMSIVLLFRDSGTAALTFGEIQRTLQSPAGRSALAKELAGDIRRDSGGGLRLKSLTVGAPVALGLGQGSLKLPIVFRTSAGRIELAFDILLLDRALGLVGVAAWPRAHLAPADPQRAASALFRRFQGAFTVRNVVAPVIAGAAQAGQTLTADPGQWVGAPSTIAYQWSRCDASGTTCTPVPGAVSQTYLVGTPDRGARLKVSVSASNTVSSSSLASNPTALVP